MILDDRFGTRKVVLSSVLIGKARGCRKNQIYMTLIINLIHKGPLEFIGEEFSKSRK